MINALCKYYDRKSNLAQEGFKYESIAFIIVISKYGNFISIDDTREDSDGKKKIAKSYLVPITKIGGRSRDISPNLLYDNCQYVLGITKLDLKKDIEKQKEIVQKKHIAFIDLLETKLSKEAYPNGLNALLAFLKNDPLSLIKNGYDGDFDKLLKELYTTNISFRISGDIEPLCTKLSKYIIETEISSSNLQPCLVSGQLVGEIVELHPKINGVFVFDNNSKKWKASNNVSLVSFNKKEYCYYNKEQGVNSPISKQVAQKYGTALNNLLEWESKNKTRAGDTTIVFWSDIQTELENDFNWFVSETSTDDPDSEIRAIKSLYNSIESGILDNDIGKTNFYILGLSAPSDGRLSVKFWKQGTVAEFSKMFYQHFEDLKLYENASDKYTIKYALNSLLRGMSLNYDINNLPPNLARDIITAILNNIPYPITLLTQILNRIRHDKIINHSRIALLKAYLNRYYRFTNHEQREEVITMALNVKNQNVGYLLGRFFAVLESIQAKAFPDRKGLLSKKYYSSFSSTPIIQFPKLNDQNVYNMSQLDIGSNIYYKKMIQEIFESLTAIPNTFSLEQQAQFAIGYWQQNQYMFLTKEEKEMIKNNNENETSIPEKI